MVSTSGKRSPDPSLVTCSLRVASRYAILHEASPVVLDAKWVKGIRAWVKKILIPRMYRVVDDPVDHLLDLTHSLETLWSHLNYNIGFLPRGPGFEGFLQDIRRSVQEYMESAMSTVQDLKGRVKWLTQMATAGTYDAEENPEIHSELQKPGELLRHYQTEVAEGLKKVDNILSMGMLGYLTRIFNKHGELDAEEVVTQFTLGRMTVLWDSGSANGNPIRDPRTVADYIEPFQHARALLERRGLGFLWYGRTWVSCEECGGTNGLGAGFGVGAHYFPSKDIIRVYSRPVRGLEGLLIHEIGHRYYYKFMTPRDRAGFDNYFKSVPATSPYGATISEEDFAEVFRSFVLGEDLSRDQVERFKAFLARDDRQRMATQYRNGIRSFGPG